jgi:hypothetical protein
MVLTWFKVFLVVVSSYVLFYAYIPEIAHSIILSGVLFATGFFYLLNFSGKGAIFFVIGHVVIFGVCVCIGLLLGALSVLKYGKMGLLYFYQGVGFVQKTITFVRGGGK